MHRTTSPANAFLRATLRVLGRRWQRTLELKLRYVRAPRSNGCRRRAARRESSGKK